MNSLFSRLSAPYPAFPKNIFFSKNDLSQVLMAAVAISLILVAAGSFHTSRISRNFQKSVAIDFQLQQLSGAVTHLDEVRTMSARMAATTGDLSWEKRYKAYSPVLVEAINQAIALAPEAYNIHAKQIDATNLKLVEIENEAFALVRKKTPEQALVKLFSDEYNTQKELYATGLQLWTQFLDSKVKSDLQRYERGLFWSGVFSMTSFWLLILAWAGLFYRINQYIRRRQATEETLRKTQRQLEINQQNLQSLTTQIRQKETLLETTRSALQHSRDRLIQNDFSARLGRLVSGALQVMRCEPNVESNTNIPSGKAETLLRSLHTFTTSEITPTDIDIQASIDNTLGLLQYRLKGTPERAAITLSRHYESLPTIEGYAASLSQVFLTLLTHAIDTIDETGRAPAHSPSGQHRITLRTATFTDSLDIQWVKITVASTGRGIPYDTQALIFNPFDITQSATQKNGPQKNDSQKNGIGLATSYKIITEKHNGKLTVTSMPNQGSEFIIQLPAALQVSPPHVRTITV